MNNDLAQLKINTFKRILTKLLAMHLKHILKTTT